MNICVRKRKGFKIFQVLERAAEDSARAEISAGQPAVPVTLQRPVDDSTARELVLARAEAAAPAALLITRVNPTCASSARGATRLESASGRAAGIDEHRQQAAKLRQFWQVGLFYFYSHAVASRHNYSECTGYT